MMDEVQPAPDGSKTRSSEVVLEGEGWTIQRVAPECVDAERDEALCELVRTLPLGGPIPIVEDRGADFFALRQAWARGNESAVDAYLARDGAGDLVGVVGVTVHAVHHGAETIPAGKVFDLRVARALRGARLFPRLLHAALADVNARRGTEFFYTGLHGYDPRVLYAFIHREPRRYEQPMAQVMTRFDLFGVPIGGRNHIPKPARHVQRASEEHLGELSDFLARRHATRALGDVVTAELIGRHLMHWTGLRLHDFFIVHGEGGRIVGCAAPWDATPMRRFIPLAPFVRPFGERLSAMARGIARRLPAGLPIAHIHLTHLGIQDDDPSVLSDLFGGILAALRRELDDGGRGVYLILALPRASALRHAITPLLPLRVPLSLLALTLAGSRLNNVDFRTGRAALEAAFL